jgi:hypothetical protein
MNKPLAFLVKNKDSIEPDLESVVGEIEIYLDLPSNSISEPNYLILHSTDPSVIEYLEKENNEIYIFSSIDSDANYKSKCMNFYKHHINIQRCITPVEKFDDLGLQWFSFIYSRTKNKIIYSEENSSEKLKLILDRENKLKYLIG